MTTLVEVPGVGEVEFPDNMPAEQIQSAVSKLVAQQPGYDVATRRIDPTLAAIHNAMRNPQGNSQPSRSYPLSLGPFGKVKLRGWLADAANAMNNVDRDTSIPIALATAGSLVAGPVVGARAAMP